MGKTNEHWVQDAHSSFFNTNIALAEVRCFQPDSCVLANPSLERGNSALGTFGLDFDFRFERHRHYAFVSLVDLDIFNICDSTLA